MKTDLNDKFQWCIVAIRRLRARHPRMISRLVVVGLLFTALASIYITKARAEQLRARRYTRADGLETSDVRNMVRDSTGFLWFCMQDGLRRFDGARFVSYQIDDPPSLSDGVLCIHEVHCVYWID